MGDPGIIDRRLNGKDKSIGNRERFLKRYKARVREAVRRQLDKDGIKGVGDDGADVSIPQKDLSEPVFHHGSGGVRDTVHPGNKDWVTGDHIERPSGGGSGSGKGQASDSGEGEDDFVFHLSKEEFMQIFFEDLALPNLIKTSLQDTSDYKWQRAGFQTVGTPTNLDLVRSKKNQFGRKIGTGIKKRLTALIDELALLQMFWEHELELSELPEADRAMLIDAHEKQCSAIEDEIKKLREHLAHFGALDPLDLRYRARQKIPVPYSKAVMFCLMDISGSMDEERKDLAKRFFILLYLFLTRHYEKIDIVFIRHHTQAKEVSEDEFFHATETGGTVVSSALMLMEEIIRERYSPSEWNIYGAQASDGDNWHQDSGRCKDLVVKHLLPLCRYFAYIQVADQEQNLWTEYASISKDEHGGRFAMKKALDTTQIYPVFRELFKKGGGA